MRELMRLKREKEAERQREEERLEIERRRAMPEEQRLKEDLERAEKLREEKSKGGGAFLQKYWHKGAFYQVQLFSSRSLQLLTKDPGHRGVEKSRLLETLGFARGRIVAAKGYASQGFRQA